MAVLNTGLAVEQEVIVTSTASIEANFNALCTGVTLHCTENAYIAFDRAAQVGDFYLIADKMIDIPNIQFTKISALQVSTSGNLYILARR